MEKLCSKCKTNESRPGQGTCPSCHNEYQKAWYKKNRKSSDGSLKRRRKAAREYVIAAKSIPCMDCGVTYPWYVMDFDHRRGKKRFSLCIAAARGWSIKTIQEEIDKCDAVCANCHRIRTFSGLV